MFEINQKLLVEEIMKIFKKCSNGSVLSQLVHCLHQVGQGDFDVISEFLNILCTTDNEVRRRWSASGLQRIAVNSLQAINGLIQILKNHDDEKILLNVSETLKEIAKENSEAVSSLLEILNNSDKRITLKWTALSLQKLGLGNPEAISKLSRILDNTQHEYTLKYSAESLQVIDSQNPKLKPAFLKIIKIANSEENKIEAVISLNKADPGNPECIVALENIIEKTKSERIRIKAAIELGIIDPRNSQAIYPHTGSPVVINMSIGCATSITSQILKDFEDKNVSFLSNFIKDTQDELDLISAVNKLEIMLKEIRKSKDSSSILENNKNIVLVLKGCLSHEMYQNHFDRFNECYKLIWSCAQSLPYSEFFQAWNPEIIQQFSVPFFILESIQHLPIYCLSADILADETDPSEIAPTLCQLIWDKACPDEVYPEAVTTASQLRQYLKQLKLRQKLPKLAILITDCPPNDKLITFCRKLTNIVAIAWLTDQPLEPPLKGFPPNQSNLISAIETWLAES